MKTAYLFPGQGVQKAGMAKDFYEAFAASRPAFDLPDLDFDLKEVTFQGPQESLDRPDLVQSCLCAACLSMAAAAQEILPADAAAGLSLGEYAALAHAGVFSLKDVPEIVRQRGLLMAQALPAGTSGMAAVLTDQVDLVENIVQDLQKEGVPCWIANYNSPVQTVISGSLSGLETAREKLSAAGIRRIRPLNTAGAFHTPLLQKAGEKLRSVLAACQVQPPHIPVVLNVTADLCPDDPRELLCQQICSSVLFVQSLHRLKELGIDTWVEIGPGNVLSHLVKKTFPQDVIVSVQSTEDLEKLRALAAQSAA